MGHSCERPGGLGPGHSRRECRRTAREFRESAGLVGESDLTQTRVNLETTIAIERAVATGKPVRLPLET